MFVASADNAGDGEAGEYVGSGQLLAGKEAKLAAFAVTMWTVLTAAVVA